MGFGVPLIRFPFAFRIEKRANPKSQVSPTRWHQGEPDLEPPEDASPWFSRFSLEALGERD